MDDQQKVIEELKNEIVSLKVRLRRVEGFIESMPSPDQYLSSKPINDKDPLYEEAKKIVCEYDRASASLIQRKLSVGYARAARLLDILEENKIVGPDVGSKPREVLVRNK